MKPEYDAGKNLKEQLDAAVAFYDSEIQKNCGSTAERRVKAWRGVL